MIEAAPVNGVEIRFIGMSRSGIHAVINWILRQIRGRYCFLNRAEGKSSPFATARPMDDGRLALTNIAGLDLVAERLGHRARKDYLLFSHEDSFLRDACSTQLECDHDRFVGRSWRRIDVLLLRDPFNLFASRYRSAAAAASAEIAAQIWKQHAREALAPRPKMLLHEPTIVLYNRWVSDIDYRRRLAEALGLRFTDAGIRDVPACRGGSSFDGLRYDGDAGAMRVLERWRRVASEPGYRALFDPGMVAMSDALFGRVDGGELIPRRA